MTHANDPVTEHHHKQLLKHNPEFHVVRLTPASHPDLPFWDYDNMWMYNDTMIYKWLLSPDYIKAERYCWFDWDTLCEENVKSFYGDAWDAELAATNVSTITNNKQWQWFDHARKNNELRGCESRFKGITPFCGAIIKHDLLQACVMRMMREQRLWRAQNNEMRLATCAELEGAKLTELPKKSIQFKAHMTRPGGITHPVKQLVKTSADIQLTERRKVLMLSAAYSLGSEMTRDIEASMEVFKGWDVGFYGQGQPFESYVKAKMIDLRGIVERNVELCDYILYVDSNDSLMARDFDQGLIDKFESFGADVVFCGEANCYPMPEFAGLYKSAARLRYLNSGCYMCRARAMMPLLNEALAIYDKFPVYKKIGYQPPGDQTYYQVCLFRQDSGLNIKVDERGDLFVSTAGVPDAAFRMEDRRLLYVGASPYILHCQGNDKHDRKREFMRKLNIPVRG